MKQFNLIEIISKERKILFYNFLFWFIHWIVWLIIEPNNIKNIKDFISLSVEYIVPFLLTIAISFILKKKIKIQSPLITNVIIMIILSILFGIVWIIEHQIIAYLLWGQKFYLSVDHKLLRAIWLNTYPFIAWSSIYYGFYLTNELIVQKQKVEKAATLAQSAQSEMLRYQLNPHFLFNTLSSLRALIKRKDNDIAEDVVTKISEFLKYSLLEGENSKVPLAKEIKTINHYFDIEKIRFKDQLNIVYTIDYESEKFYIPVFLIHPLVENAVKHGMKTSSSPLNISIIAEVVNGNLRIEIINSGQWIERIKKDDMTRTGLQNTRKRLELAYPNNHTFVIIKREDSVCIRIIINENSNN